MHVGEETVHPGIAFSGGLRGFDLREGGKDSEDSLQI